MTNKHLKPVKVPSIIRHTAHFLAFFSETLATRFVKYIFITPQRHQRPKREQNMYQHSKKELVWIASLGLNVQTYQYGKGSKKALLIHGWSGRASQFSAIEPLLLEENYHVISFDAPAHGDSEGKQLIMSDVIQTVQVLREKYGEFELIIGHSLGGMVAYNLIKKGFRPQKMITIAAGNDVIEIFDQFVKHFGLKPSISKKMQLEFEKKYAIPVTHLSVNQHTEHYTEIPHILIIHDADDPDVLVHCGREIKAIIPHATYFETQKLGHRKVLGAHSVLQKIKNFITI